MFQGYVWWVPEIKARKIKQATFKQDYLSKTHLSKTDIKARHIKAKLFLYINKYQKIVCTYLDSHSWCSNTAKRSLARKNNNYCTLLENARGNVTSIILLARPSDLLANLLPHQSSKEIAHYSWFCRYLDSHSRCLDIPWRLHGDC